MARCRCLSSENSGCQCGIADSDTIAASGTGSIAAPFSLAVNLDPDDNNDIVANSNGLYSEGARGILAIAQVDFNQGSINPIANLAGLSVGATIPANRRIRVSAFNAGMTSSAGPEAWAVEIREGGGVISARFIDIVDSLGRITGGGVTTWDGTPAPGAHTYYLTLSRSTGTGTGTNIASGSAQSRISIEDLGPA